MAEEQLRELFSFLRDRNPEVRRLALSNLISQTPNDSPYRNIFLVDSRTTGSLKKREENGIINDLKLLCRDQLSIAHDAFRALVNLSDSPLVIAKLSDAQFLNFLVSYIITPNAILADLGSMLLSNLSASPATCASLIALKISIITDESSPVGYYATQSRCGTCVAPEPYPPGQPHAAVALPLLIDAFARAALKDSAGNPVLSRKGELHFLAGVLANLSSTAPGREFFLTPQPKSNNLQPNSENEYPLASIIAFTEHKDKIRRGGVASTLKNCAFHISAHRALLSSESTKVAISPSKLEGSGIDVLSYLLLPLAGPEEFDLEDQERLLPALQFLPPTKKREPESSIRLTLVETLIILCTTRWGRDFQRDHGVYEIIRAAHGAETHDKISDHMEKLVNFLKREEAAYGEEDAELSIEMTARHSSGLDSDSDDQTIAEV